MATRLTNLVLISANSHRIFGMAATTQLTQFGAWLRQLRKQHRLTLKIVGDMTGKHFADVQKIETGVRLPDAGFCIDLVNGLARIGIPVELNDVLRLADLEPVQGGAGVGGTAIQPDGERNGTIDRRQWLIQQIRAALADPLLDDDTFEALSQAVIALRKSLEKSQATRGHGSNRGAEPQRKAAGGSTRNYSIST